jgi:hypothetical protein
MSDHPAAQHADQLAWAIWIEDGNQRECYAVIGDAEEIAREAALERHDSDEGTVAHVDGPYQDSKPGVWKFEFTTRHREQIVVEAPNKDYAAETAAADRDYNGEFVETLHTESWQLNVDPNDSSENSGEEKAKNE